MSGSTTTAGLFTIAAAVLAATVLVSACASNTVGPGTATSPAQAAMPGGVLGVAATALGPVLVDGKGFTVYLLTADTPGHSSCSAQCLQIWPAVPAPSGAEVPTVPGVSAALSVTTATSGAPMLAAGGSPLYTFVKDKAPGDVTGQGVQTFGGTWYAVSPSGEAVTSPPSSAPTTTRGGVRGGYGY